VKNDFLIGRSLSNYQIQRLIGRGGMAEVYFGMDTRLNRPVAIKVFDTRSPANSSQAKRFLQEARMMAQWRHNHILQIYSAGDETGLIYYVMEFIDGYDLASIMSVYAERGELMPFEDVLRIGDAVAGALDYAHARGVIHRDVKPANVMIADDGRVVLGDFGLALDLSDKSQGEVFGSPHYISPEQARRSSDAVPQSDLYSLGVILYEMLTGATPFNDPSPASLALQHITEPPPSPRTINPALSENVEAVLLKALEKKTSERYQSGAALMDAVRGALILKPASAPMDAPPLPPLPAGAPTVQRSEVSLNSFTKQQDVITALGKKNTSGQRIVVWDEPKPQQTPMTLVTRILTAVALLVAVLFLGWKYGSNIFAPLAQGVKTTATVKASASPIGSATEQPASANPTKPEQASENTALPSPKVQGPTATSLATQTQTATPTNTSTPSPTATETPLPEPTIKYPNGFLFTAYYDAISFYLLDKGEVSRSVAGFSFDRINADGTFQNHFGGWEWEKNYKIIQFNHCISLQIYPVANPYLEPLGCEKRILTNLRFAPNSDKLFWTPNDTSQQFRVLWLEEEIARCEIDAGTCDFYIP